MKKFFSLLALILLMVGFEAQAADEIYAVVSGKTMTIKYGEKPTSDAYSVSEWTAQTGWIYTLHAKIHDVVETVEFDATMQNAKPTSLKEWFSKFIALKQIKNMQYLNTSDVTTMRFMFNKCGLLEAVDLSGFKTDNLTDMGDMFYACTSVKELNLSSFNTANVSDMYSMFYDCRMLKKLDLSNFNTANVKYMQYMFKNCIALEEVDIRNFNVEKVQDMAEMFYGCPQLRTIYCINDLGANNNITNESNKADVFKGCTSLVGGKNSACDGASDIDVTFARLDGIGDKKGYFTAVKEVYTEYADGVLTYRYDNERLYSDKNPELYDPTKKRFSGYNSEVLSAVIDPSMKDANLTTTNMMFYGKNSVRLDKLASISGLENLNTANVTNMAYMFYNCKALESLDLKGFNTANVTTMLCMFDGCAALKELDLSSFNTSNVEDMTFLFCGCSALEKVDLSSFDTRKMTSMKQMFDGCSALKELDLSSFDTRKLQNMSYTFRDCSALEKIDLSMLNTSNVASMNSVFTGCTALQEADLSGFDTKKVVDMSSFFFGCSSLKTIYCSGDWNTDNSIVNPNYKKNLFMGCTALEGGKDTKYNSSYVDIDYARVDGVSGNKGYFTPAKEVYTEYEDGVLTYRYDNNFYYSTKNPELYDPEVARFTTYYGQIEKAVIDPSMAEAKLTTTRYMFFGKEENKLAKLAEIEGLENLNTENVTNMYGMFAYCAALKDLDLRGLKTAKVTTMRSMFIGCTALEQLNISSFNTVQVANMKQMFCNCKALESIDVSGLNTANVDSTAYMFYGCEKLKSLDLSSFNTRYVMDMSYMFFNCKALESVDLSSFDTHNTKTMAYMFKNCAALKELNLNSFNMDGVTTTASMFEDCSALTTIYCTDIWNAMTTSTNMFNGCTALVGGNQTKYSDSYKDKAYARLDGLGGQKGYFTNTAEVYTEYEDGVLTYRYDDQRLKSYKKAEKYDGAKLRFEGYRNDITKVIIDASMRDANLKTTSSMFCGSSVISGHGLENLEKIEGLENLNTENVVDMNSMFSECKALTALDLSHFNTAKVGNIAYMFDKCEKLEKVDISSFKVDKVVYAQYMFRDCSKLTTIYNNNDWSELGMYIYAYRMFYNCEKLTGRKGTKYDSSKPDDNTYARLDGGKDKPGYFTGVYTVTLEAENGTADVNESGVKLNHVLEGTKLTFSATPNEGYVFEGWTNYDPASGLIVTDNVTVTANFKLQTFTVTFYDWNNTELKTETVEYGKAATAPADPVREGFVFTGWDSDFSKVTRDMKIYATYKSTEGIDNVQSDNVQCTKVLRNGQIYILRGEKMYDVSGKEIK